MLNMSDTQQDVIGWEERGAFTYVVLLARCSCCYSGIPHTCKLFAPSHTHVHTGNSC